MSDLQERHKFYLMEYLPKQLTVKGGWAGGAFIPPALRLRGRFAAKSG
jgi:hypothetical protein